MEQGHDRHRQYQFESLQRAQRIAATGAAGLISLIEIPPGELSPSRHFGNENNRVRPGSRY